MSRIPMRVLLAVLAVGAVALAMVPPSAQAETAPDLTAMALQEARVDLIRCEAALRGTLSSAARNEATRCRDIARQAIAGLTVTPSPSPTTLPPATPTPSPSSTTPTPSPTSPSPSPTTPSPGWPGPDNTGVPAGTVLTTYTGPCTITTANTVIDAKSVGCRLTIQTTGVLITRSRVLGGVDNGTRAEASFRIEDSEIIAPADQTAVGEVNFTVLRSELRGGNRGGHCYAHCVIEDSWVHGTRFSGDNHASGLRAGQWTTFRHNSISCDAENSAQDGGCSASLTMYPDWTPIHHVTIDRNLIRQTPGDYCAYGGWEPYKYEGGHVDNATYMVFSNNTFERGWSGRCANTGPITSWRGDRVGNVWSGNVWDTGGAVTP
jgi:hypothetical protein